MDDLKCKGTEIRLSDCDFKGWGRHNCGHGKDVGIICEEGKPNIYIIFNLI